jgi:hypothetical protein
LFVEVVGCIGVWLYVDGERKISAATVVLYGGGGRERPGGGRESPGGGGS